MQQTVREWMIYRTPSPVQDGVCVIEILPLKDGRNVIIVEELEDNPGQSVSNAWECVVAAVHDKYHIAPSDAVWIEHEPNPVILGSEKMSHWQLVTFQNPPPGKILGKVEWRSMSSEDWHELGLTPRE